MGKPLTDEELKGIVQATDSEHPLDFYKSISTVESTVILIQIMATELLRRRDNERKSKEILDGR